jgi:hypothetical protein
MRILVACEFSGIVRDAFIARGHNAISCDLEPTEKSGPHIITDVRRIAQAGKWDMMIAFPPCRFLALSGARWWSYSEQQEDALAFVLDLMNCDIPKIAIENPVGAISTRICMPTQVIQPWQFGHGEIKKTCLWLQGLPKLTPTNIVSGREARVHRVGPYSDRVQQRSRTLTGIAEAMASQWG